jgi:hypothetical protein
MATSEQVKRFAALTVALSVSYWNLTRDRSKEDPSTIFEYEYSMQRTKSLAED